MAVVVLHDQITQEDLEFVKKDYGNYVKIVVDVENEILAAGGEWHADAERVLLKQGSKQKNLWGAGIDLASGQVDYISLINTRPGVNSSQEVSDVKLREKMLTIIKRAFSKYVRQG